MPVALERKLKQQVADKKMSKERKDAYVYGTLRKTGWKPSRERNKEKKMESLSPNMVRLEQIDKNLDSIIRFQSDDEPRPATYSGLAKIGAVAGTGTGGLILNRAILKQGGYRAALKAGKSAFEEASSSTGQMLLKGMQGARGVGATVGTSLGKAVSSIGKFAKPLLGKFGLSSKEKTIEFDASILGPWHGSKGHESKIDQLEFPAGLSPAAVLKLPFPKLMAYLNQRNLMQQQFSWKHQRLIQLKAKLDEINA